MRRLGILVVVAISLSCLTVWLGLTLNIRIPDSEFVVYRYVEHLATWQGPYYNANQPSDLSPAWLQIVVLIPGAVIHALPSFDMILNVSLTALGAILLYLILSTDPDPPLSPLAAFGGAILYLLGTITWQTLYTEHRLAVVLVLGAILALQRHRYVMAGLLMGLGIFAGLETLVFVGLVMLQPIKVGRVGRGLVPALAAGITGIVLLRFAWRPLILDANTETPVTVINHLLDQSNVWLIYLPTILIGWAGLSPTRRLIAAWGAVHVLVTWALLGNLSVLPAWIAAVVVGISSSWRLPRWATAGIILVLAVWQFTGLTSQNFSAAASGDASQVAVGTWLDANTPPNAVVGSDLIGKTAYYAGRTFVDMNGRLDLDIASANNRGDLNYGPLHTLPDYFVTQQNPAANWQNGLGDWFAKIYSPAYQVGNWEIYARQKQVAQLGPTRPVDISLNDRLRLVGMAQSTNAIEPNSTVWFRLDWDVRTGNSPYRLDLSVFNLSNQLFSLSSLPIVNTVWQDGKFSTYHLLVLGPDPIPAGLLPMLVKVSYAPPDPEYPSPVVQHIRGKSVVDMDAVSGSSTSVLWGSKDNQVRLRAATAETAENHQLKVTLYWESLGPLAADYHVFVHMHAAGTDSDLAAQADGTPTYPTSTWEVGETFADVHVLDLAKVPPGNYWLAVGLYTAQGDRLKLSDGQDHLGIYNVQISGQFVTTQVIPPTR